MKVLVYKRTHQGDPCEHGLFGVGDCMGSVRSYVFDAVIGVGGKGLEPRREGIAKKLTWIGIGPKCAGRAKRGPVWSFRHFILFEEHGPAVRDLAPNLALRMYRWHGPRFIAVSSDSDYEIATILKLAEGAPVSEGHKAGRACRACRKSEDKHCRPCRTSAHEKQLVPSSVGALPAIKLTKSACAARHDAKIVLAPLNGRAAIPSCESPQHVRREEGALARRRRRIRSGQAL